MSNELFERNCAVLAEWYAGKCERELQVTNAMGGWAKADQEVQLPKTCEYRLKPITILVNGIEVPEPVRDIILGKWYWFISLDNWDVVYKRQWLSLRSDYAALENGMVHLTEENARKHASAIISVSKVTK